MVKFDLKKAILENKATFFSSLNEGQFSWMTQDTGQQIGSEEENTIPVYMFDNTGKYYYEPNYDGYGVFGGKDYYELLDQMNGGKGDRDRGIDLAFNKEETSSPVLFPALVTSPSNFNYKNHDFTKEAESDPNQSWYAEPEYDEEDDFYRGYDDEDEENEEELEEGYMGQFYAPEYLEQKYGKEMASKIEAEIDEMDENSYDRFTGMESAEEVENYIVDIKDMLNLNEGTIEEAYNSYTFKVAKNFAKYMSKKEGRDFEVTMNSVDEYSFDLDLDGEPYAGGSYLIQNGNIHNVAIPGNPIYATTDDMEDYIGEGYDEFKRADKGSKGVTAKNKGEEEVYGAGVKKGEKIEKKKMKMSEFKAKIKEMVLAEMNLDIDNMEDAPESEVDFLAEIKAMLNEEEGLTPLQDYVYQYEIEISGEDQAQEFLDDIKQLNTPQDVYDYYAYGRDLKDSDLDNIFRQVKRKFASSNTADDLTPLQKRVYSYTKERFGFEDAKNSLDQIKTLTTSQEFIDWLNKKIEAEKSLNENTTADIEKKIKSGEIDAKEIEAAAKKAMSGDSTDLALMMAGFGKMFEAKKDEEVADEEIEVTDEFSTEEPQGPGGIDVAQNADADLTGDKKDVQDNLEAALEAAKALGDDKLATQIGNSLTFFTKQHVVKEDLNKDEELGTPSEGMHNTLLSYIKQDARATYPKDYNKYFIFLRAQAKPMSGPNKPQIWMKFLKDLVKNKAVSMNDLIDFSEKGYNNGGPGLEGLATYLFKQGNPEILRKIDNLSNQSNINESMFPILKRILK